MVLFGEARLLVMRQNLGIHMQLPEDSLDHKRRSYMSQIPLSLQDYLADSAQLIHRYLLIGKDSRESISIERVMVSSCCTAL